MRLKLSWSILQLRCAGPLNYELKEKAIKNIGNCGDIRGVPPLIPWLGCDTPRIKEAARNALEKLGAASDLFDVYVKALNNYDPDISEYGARALGTLGDKRAIEPIVEAAEDRNLGWNVYGQAISALKRLGAERECIIRAIRSQLIKQDYHIAVVRDLVEWGEERDIEPSLPARESAAKVGSPR